MSFPFVLLWGTFISIPDTFQGPSQATSHRALLEENAKWLLKQMTNPTGDPGQGVVETRDVFAGRSCVKIIPMQRFHPGIPGWKFKIRKNPQKGEYRYLRFAWKAEGCAGIMIQFHDVQNWNLRYTAGIDRYNWGSKFVAPTPPTKWTVVTCDLFKDFGERELSGMALTAFGGRAAYFDHIYLARSIAELDRIDATDSRKTKATKLTLKQMEQYWKDLLDEDASLAYRALWRLSASTQAVEFLKKKLTPSSRGATLKQIRQWIKELDADEHKIRESATVLLTRHLLIAAPLLKLTLKKPPSLEVKRRIQKILKRMVKSERELLRRAQAIRALEHAGSLESRRCLELLAKDRDHLSTATLAKTALMRLKLRDRK